MGPLPYFFTPFLAKELQGCPLMSCVFTNDNYGESKPRALLEKNQVSTYGQKHTQSNKREREREIVGLEGSHISAQDNHWLQNGAPYNISLLGLLQATIKWLFKSVCKTNLVQTPTLGFFLYFLKAIFVFHNKSSLRHTFD